MCKALTLLNFRHLLIRKSYNNEKQESIYIIHNVEFEYILFLIK